MFAVEVFTGEMPFKNRRNEAVALLILQGNRPEMPRNSQTVGLTGDMWNLLQSCWQPDPSNRPTMEELVGRWQEFVECSNDDSSIDIAVTWCVKIIRVVRASPPVPSSTSYSQLRKPQPTTQHATGTPRPRAKTEAVQPRTKCTTLRPRTKSEAIQSRTAPGATRPRKKSVQTRFVRRGTKSDVVRPPPEGRVPFPSESFLPGGHRSQILTSPEHLNVGGSGLVEYSNPAGSWIGSFSHPRCDFSCIYPYHYST